MTTIILRSVPILKLYPDTSAGRLLIKSNGWVFQEECDPFYLVLLSHGKKAVFGKSMNEQNASQFAKGTCHLLNELRHSSNFIRESTGQVLGFRGVVTDARAPWRRGRGSIAIIILMRRYRCDSPKAFLNSTGFFSFPVSSFWNTNSTHARLPQPCGLPWHTRDSRWHSH